MAEGEYKSVYLAFLDLLGFSNFILTDSKRIDLEMKNKSLEEKQRKKIQSLKYRYKFIDTIITGPITNFSTINTQTKYIGRDIHVPDYKKSQINSLFFADSVFLWTDSNSIIDFTKIIYIVQKIMRSFYFVHSFPVRGAISSGYMIFENIIRNNYVLNYKTTILGDAVVKAVKLEGNQNWSGCCVHNDCINYLLKDSDSAKLLDILFDRKILVEYDIPFKNKTKNLSKYVVNWIDWQVPDLKDYFENIIRKCFKKSTDKKVIEKMNNTLKFADFILSIN